MRLKWTGRALSDLSRVRQFLLHKNHLAAHRAGEIIVAAAWSLQQNPRLGRPLKEFCQQEVRERIVDNYILRYRINGEVIEILRIWHGRESQK